MRKHSSTYVVLLLSTFVISQLTGHTASAAAVSSVQPKSVVAAATVTAPSNLGSVSLGANIKATLEDVNIWSQPGGNILTYTINYSNGSNKSASLLYYFSRVMTSGGSVIPGNPLSADATKKKVGSNESLRVTYYVNVGQVNSLKGIKIPMYVWDSKTKGYLKQVGTFNIPANYSPTAVNGKNVSTTMNDIPVVAKSESLELYKYSGKVYAKVGISLTNKGSKVLSDPGYAAYLVSAGGSSYELALDRSQLSYKIQPQEKKTIYYLTEIPSYMKTENMKLQFTQKDEALKLEIAKSSYKLPAATTPNLVVGKGVIKKIAINNNTVETQLNNATVYAENNKGFWTFQLRVKNTGKTAVTLPSYELAVKSSTGTTFPINSKGLSGLTIKPLEEKIIPLTAQVPLEVEQNSLQLQMIEAVSAPDNSETGTTGEGAGTGSTGGTNVATSNTAKLTVPVAYFTISYTLRPDIQKGMEYRATNEYGTFTYSLVSLQRFPWKDDDIVVARLNITNTQTIAMSLPELKGAVQVDNEDMLSSTELFMDKETSTIGPGKNAEIYVFAKIPYTQEFDKLKLDLYSVVKEEKSSFLSVTTNSMMNAVASIETGGSYVISGKGKNAKVQENKTIIYEGLNSNLVYTELLLSSEEKRQSKMARLQAYYKTEDGQLFEATANQPDTSATPGGKQLITFWAKVPKTVNTSDVSLFLGPGITGNKLTEPGQESTGFINMASLSLNPVTTPPEKNLTKVAIYPYTMSVLSSEGRSLQGSDSINIVMNYNLLRDSSYDMGTFTHKLVLKMTDPYGLSQERSLNIGTDILEGTNNSYTASFSNNMYKNLSGGTYRITLYDEFQGERIELASQAYNIKIDKAVVTEK
ncbi:hypothetical protein [Paenibacillus odorifer]|uniref:hypothetical protein n=1 Tax=Paenibacillus TaxID=44249 RepID=UPI0009D6C6C6|nr:hypothetical protein [Paenibacillus odorifer]